MSTWYVSWTIPFMAVGCRRHFPLAAANYSMRAVPRAFEELRHI